MKQYQYHMHHSIYMAVLWKACIFANVACEK